MILKSSTPIGSSLFFERSQSELKLDDIYTDENQDVLIVRFNTDNGQALPFKGTDYKVYLSSPSLDGYEEASIIFGRMSTDGDFFLVIPKPSDDVYSVFIMNTKYLGGAVADGDVGSTQEIKEIDETNMKQSLSKALSDYKYTDKDNLEATYTVPDDYSDIISFRVTKDPAIKTSEYEPKVIKENLITPNNEFDFELFFNSVFKDSALNQLKAERKKLEESFKQTKQLRADYEERLQANPNDETAISGLSRIDSEEEQITAEQVDIAKKISQYESLDYNPDLFSNLQTKAYIVPSNFK